MVKSLVFKGDKRSKKRKIRSVDNDDIKTLAAPDSVSANDELETWVSADSPSDIIGPIVFAVPSSPPSCITCDTNGKVFLSNIENIIDGDLATAEPHDIRQVWVASRLAGADGISFKGHHGRYLSCDKIGFLSALHEAISPEEVFLCNPNDSTPGAFSIQAESEKFLTVSDNAEGPKIRGDADSDASSATFRIQMQARFKPKLVMSRETVARAKISRKELEEVVGRKLEGDEVRKLKKARAEGNYHEALLDAKVKKKHDKYA